MKRRNPTLSTRDRGWSSNNEFWNLFCYFHCFWAIAQMFFMMTKHYSQNQLFFFFFTQSFMLFGLCSFLGWFLRCLDKFVVLYTAMLLQSLNFFLLVVSSVKYLWQMFVSLLCKLASCICYNHPLMWCSHSSCCKGYAQTSEVAVVIPSEWQKKTEWQH